MNKRYIVTWQELYNACSWATPYPEVCEQGLTNDEQYKKNTAHLYQEMKGCFEYYAKKKRTNNGRS